MIQQDFIIVCESAMITEGSKNLNLFGIFEYMSAPGVPVIHPKFCVVTKFEGGEGEHSHDIIIRYEATKEEIAKLKGKIVFSPNKKAQYIGTFIGFPFKNFGKYIIEIYVDDILQPLVESINVIPEEKK